jgi:hypothetical protein
MQQTETTHDTSIVERLLTIRRNERSLLRDFGAARSLRPAHAILRMGGLGA